MFPRQKDQAVMFFESLGFSVGVFRLVNSDRIRPQNNDYVEILEC